LNSSAPLIMATREAIGSATAPMPQQKLKMPRPTSPRAAFHQRQKQRIHNAETLATKFPRLKSVKVDIEYYAPDNETRIGHIKYVLNVEHAKSLFCFECPNRECVRGDFDLSEVLVAAVAARRKSVAGEMRCQGWRNQEAIKKAYCRNVMRYRLQLKY
jgi:hypothetical protein